ncbi:MAG TPA: hypothetical protein VHT91_26895 [Kofleriaceae bacterium]|nr:hypothetical protein [Kofleriaceae bacterium]
MRLAQHLARAARIGLLEAADLLGDVGKLPGRLRQISHRLACIEDPGRIGLERLRDLADLPLELVDLAMDELVDQLKLKERVVGDVLDLILTVEIDTKDDILADVDLGGFALGVDDERSLAAAPGDRVGRRFGGLDLDPDTAATQVVVEQLLDRLVPGLVAVRIRHAIERVPDRLEHAGLAGAAAPDDAVQAIVKLEPDSLQETAGQLDRLDLVIGRRAMPG